MTKETKNRIAREAETKFPRTEKASKELTTRVWAEQRGYIAGAEAEAERGAGIVRALQELIKSWDGAKLNAITRDRKVYGDSIEMKIAKDALTTYNSKKG